MSVMTFCMLAFAFFIGILVMWALKRGDKVPYYVRQEFHRIFRDPSDKGVRAVLQECSSAIAIAYARKNMFYKPESDGLYDLGEMFGVARDGEEELAVITALDSSRLALDYAKGIAYLAGYGMVVDAIQRSKTSILV